MLLANRLWIGVPIFFVISGYCIAAAADSARTKPWPAALFLARRFRRIYPPLWAFLILAALLMWWLPEWAFPGPTASHRFPLQRPHNLGFEQWLGSITLTEEWRHHFIGPDRRYLSGQLWTLCYEEQFYAIVAIIILLARRWLYAMIAIISGYVFLNICDLSTFIPPAIAPYIHALKLNLQGCFSDGLWLAFAAGVAVFYHTHRATYILRVALNVFLLVGLLWSLNFFRDIWTFEANVPGSIAVACLTSLLLNFLHRYDTYTATARGLAPLRFCGQMCYSLYLVHAPIACILSWSLYRNGVQSSLATLIVTVPIVLMASLTASYVFYWAIERHFLNSPRTTPPPIPTEVPPPTVNAVALAPAGWTPALSAP